MILKEASVFDELATAFPGSFSLDDMLYIKTCNESLCGKIDDLGGSRNSATTMMSG